MDGSRRSFFPGEKVLGTNFYQCRDEPAGQPQNQTWSMVFWERSPLPHYFSRSDGCRVFGGHGLVFISRRMDAGFSVLFPAWMQHALPRGHADWQPGGHHAARAARLRECDVVAAEDTRRSGQLLKHFEISKPLLSYFQFNEAKRSEEIIERLRRGEKIALVTDAGSPGISDPGERVVKAAIAAGFRVEAVPGACALVAALTASGCRRMNFISSAFCRTNPASGGINWRRSNRFRHAGVLRIAVSH
jgi:hypothetical protein